MTDGFHFMTEPTGNIKEEPKPACIGLLNEHSFSIITAL
jgi:hypothetical protein